MSSLNTPILVERTLPGLHEHLVPRIPKPERVSSVLDIGCGTGAWLARLRDNGYRGLVGADLDTSQFAAAGIRCIRADLDADELDLDEASFDLVTAIEIIEHLHNPGRLLLHASRLMRADGRLLLTSPNVESALARLKFLMTGRLKHFDRYGDPTHVSPIIESCLARMLSRYGLTIDRSWGYPEDGSSPTSTLTTRMSAHLVKLVVPESRAGELSCFLIRRTNAAPSPIAS